jgi:hypothetical protein
MFKIRNQRLLLCILLHSVHIFLVNKGGLSSPKSTTSSSSYSLNNNNNNNNNKEHAVCYRCRAAYNGGGFNGFQVQQAGARTVQGDLEAVLSRRFDQPV